MTDPSSEFITEVIDIEPSDEDQIDQGILDPYTGILIMPKKYPSIDLQMTTDEEGDSTEEGDTKAKKRVWRESDKQEWLEIYGEYMQERVKRQPRPMNFRGHLAKNIMSVRNGLRNAGRTELNLKQGYPEYNSGNLESESIERVKTVKDLRRFAKPHCRRIDEGDSSKDVSQRIGKDLDPDDLKGDEAIYLYVTESDHEEADARHNVEGSADVEEYKDDEYLKEDFNSQDEKTISKEMKLQNLRYNSVTLVKYSNICLFKWRKHTFVCFECLQWFRDMRCLRKHVKNNHTSDQVTRKMIKAKHTFQNADITNLKCRLCSVKLKSLSKLEEHLVGHGIRLKAGGSALIPYKLCTDAFVCQVCEDHFITRYQLQRHMDGHFLNYICPGCDVGFPSYRSLKKHCQGDNDKFSSSTLKNNKCRLKGNKDVPRFKCNHCPRMFKTDYKRLEHLIDHHNEKSKLFQCRFCPKIFMTVHWLTKHMNCMHQDELYS